MNLAHYGDLGDLLYGLATIRALSKTPATLYLYNSPETTHRMTQERVNMIRPLLLQQPYINDVQYVTPSAPDDAINLNAWRDYMPYSKSIVDAHLKAFNIPLTERDTPWLRVTPLATDYPIIFSRSSRYHNPHFPWHKVYAKYHDQAAFIGLPDEHQQFQKDVGPLPYLPTANLLEAAQMIKGSRLFVGNQSAPAAIAHGLHAAMLLEVYTINPNCCLPRSNATYGWNQDVKIP